MEAHVGALVKHFEHVTDPHIDLGKLHEMIAIMICGVIKDCNNFKELRCLVEYIFSGSKHF